MELLRLQWLWLPPALPFSSSSSSPSSPSRFSFRHPPGSHSHLQQAFLLRNPSPPPWLSPSSDQQAEETKRALFYSSGVHHHHHRHHCIRSCSHNHNREISVDPVPNYISWYSEFSDGSPRRKVGGGSGGSDGRYDSLSPEERKLFYSEKRHFASTIRKKKMTRTADFPSERRSFLSPFSVVEKARIDLVPRKFPPPKEEDSLEKRRFALSVCKEKTTRRTDFPSERRSFSSPFSLVETERIDSVPCKYSPPEEEENLLEKRRFALLVRKEKMRMDFPSLSDRELSLSKRRSFSSPFSTIEKARVDSVPRRFSPPKERSRRYSPPNRSSFKATYCETDIASEEATPFPNRSDRKYPTNPYGALQKFPSQEMRKTSHKRNSLTPSEEVEKIERKRKVELSIPKEELKRLGILSRFDGRALKETNTSTVASFPIHSDRKNPTSPYGGLREFPSQERSKTSHKRNSLVPSKEIEKMEREGKMIIHREEVEVIEMENNPSPPMLAELLIPKEELKRLRRLSSESRKHWLKIGNAGITDDLVWTIHMMWQTSEVVKVKCHGGPLAQNMKKTQEELESKTGGLVIWMAGGAAVIYQGKDYGRTQVNEHKSSLKRQLEGVISSKNDVDFKREAKNLNNGVANLENVDETQILENVLMRSVEPEAFSIDFKGDSNSEREPKSSITLPSTGDFCKNYDQETDSTSFKAVRDIEREKEIGGKGLMDVHLEGKIYCRNHEKSMPQFNDLVSCGTDKENDNLILLGVKDNTSDTFHSNNVDPSDAQNLGVEQQTLHSDFTFDYEAKVQGLLRDLVGPHFEGGKLLKAFPMDGDLLPTITPEYKSPLRRLLYGIDLTLTIDEILRLRRRAGPLPPHFSVGRNSGHQGLAAAMLRLWEKCEFAKISMKTEAESRSSEIIAEELKRLTGGILLSRDKYCITFYRGKDFIPQAKAEEKSRWETSIPVIRPLDIDKGKDDTEASHDMGAKNLIHIEPHQQSKLITERGRQLKIFRHLRWSQTLALAGHISASEEVLNLISRSMDTIQAKLGNLSIVQPTGDLEEVYENVEPENDSDMEEDSSGEEEVDSNAEEEKVDKSSVLKKRAKESVLAKLKAECGPSYRARPLTKKERLRLRKQALQSHSPSHFHVGKSNLFGGLAKAIRLHFQKHALAKIGVKGRLRGTSAQELILELERSTGGILVSNEGTKVILYRGWPDGDMRPSSILEEKLPVELIAAMKEEDADWVDTTVLNRETISNHD